MSDIAIDTDTLRQHASGVERLAADAVEALSAVQSINLSGGAFGVLCSFCVPPVGIVSAAVGAAISGVAANLVGFSAGLTDASARGASIWVFVAVAPLALVGAWATFRMTGSARAAPESAVATSRQD